MIHPTACVVRGIQSCLVYILPYWAMSNLYVYQNKQTHIIQCPSARTEVWITHTVHDYITSDRLANRPVNKATGTYQGPRMSWPVLRTTPRTTTMHIGSIRFRLF